VSGEVPEQPVVSRKTGHLYEKRIIEKYLADHDGKSPFTQEEMTREDLIPLQGKFLCYHLVPGGIWPVDCTPSPILTLFASPTDGDISQQVCETTTPNSY
jgi:hypothetical protein